jgi:acetyl-CoA synthetase
MTDLVQVKPEIASGAHIDAAKFAAMSKQAADSPEAFWRGEMRRIAWMREPTKIKNVDFTGDVSIRWFEDGELNASVSCLDRHLETRGDQVAIIWEGDDPNADAKVTYRELHARVCRLANGLRELGVKKGDRVCIYLPMIVEAAVAMLACARVGAIHSIVFGGFSPDSLSSRIQDSECSILITADQGRRGGRTVPLKTNADEALKSCPSIRHVIVARNTGNEVPMQAGRDLWWDEATAGLPDTAEPERMGAEDPLFILYTSGSTASRRACCTPPAATWSGRPTPTSTSSTTAMARSTGARPMWAG